MSQICFLNMQNMNLPVPFLFCKTLIFVCFREIMWHSPFLLSCCCCCCCCCMWSPSWTQLDWGKEGLAQIWHFQRNLPCRKELLRNGLTSPQRSYVLFLLYFQSPVLFFVYFGKNQVKQTAKNGVCQSYSKSSFGRNSVSLLILGTFLNAILLW